MIRLFLQTVFMDIFYPLNTWFGSFHAGVEVEGEIENRSISCDRGGVLFVESWGRGDKQELIGRKRTTCGSSYTKKHVVLAGVLGKDVRRVSGGTQIRLVLGGRGGLEKVEGVGR